MTSLRRGFLVLATGNLLGKVVALVREVVFAAAFGTSAVASGFRVAQTGSMVPANLIAGDLLSAAFAPSYAIESRRDQQRASAQLYGYSIWLTITLGITAISISFLAPEFVQIIVPGADASVREQADTFLRIMSWTMPLYGVSAVFAYALGTQGRYLLTSLRPLIQSIGLLAGTLGALALGWMPFLALGFVCAWAAYTAMCIFTAARRGLLRTLRFRELVTSGSFVLHGIRSIAPLLALPLVLQASILVERLLSSFGPAGLIAAVDYARTLSESAMSLVAVPLGIIGLTQLSALSPARYNDAVVKMTRFILIVMMPLSMLMVTAAAPVVTLVFGRGAFDGQAVYLSSQVLVGLSAGLALQVLGYSLSRALTAVGRNGAVLRWTLMAIAGQVLVQSAILVSNEPILIGLGPSVFGLVLSTGCAISLRVHRVMLGTIALSVPAIFTTILIAAWDLGWIWSTAVVATAWCLNISLVKTLRDPLLDQLKPILTKLTGRTT